MQRNGLLVFVAGVAAGVALVVACNQTKNASASPNDCAVWQYAEVNDLINRGQVTFVTIGTFNVEPVAATETPGWEPFAAQADGGVLVRRCKP
jgi:hypothetical protein